MKKFWMLLGLAALIAVLAAAKQLEIRAWYHGRTVARIAADIRSHREFRAILVHLTNRDEVPITIYGVVQATNDLRLLETILEPYRKRTNIRFDVRVEEVAAP